MAVKRTAIKLVMRNRLFDNLYEFSEMSKQYVRSDGSKVSLNSKNFIIYKSGGLIIEGEYDEKGLTSFIEGIR